MIERCYLQYPTVIIDLNSFEKGTQPFKAALTAAEIDLDDDFVRLAGTVHACGEVTRQTARTNVAGKIEAPLEIDCNRCLQPVGQTLNVEFNVSFVSPADFAADKESEIGEADLETDVLAGDSLDLKDVVREQILLNLPTQSFCREDCKGLCRQCGVNRNLIDCKCEEKEIDPRWAALKNLK